MLKDALWLAKLEYKHHWMAVILTFILSIVLGLLAGSFFTGYTGVGIRGSSSFMDRFFLDFFFLAVSPALATLSMAKPYMSYQAAKHDPYGKRMAVLRSLPIPVSVLALSRTIVMLSTLFTMFLGFFASMSMVVFLLSNGLLAFITVGEYFLFMFVWFGFLLVIGGMNPYIEYGTNGKMLHLIPFMYMGFIIILKIIIYRIFGIGIVEGILETISVIGWPVSAFSIMIGVLCCYGWNHQLKRRLENRDYI